MDTPLEAPRANTLAAAWRVGLAYGVVGALWIWLSDGLVEAVSRDPGWLVAAQRYKGLVYILLTTLGLVYLVHRGYRRLLAVQDRAARSALRVRDLFEHHPQPMWVQDLATRRILRVNDAALAAYGYRPDEFLAMTVDDLCAGPAGPGTPTTPAAPATVHHRRRDGRALVARIREHAVELNGTAARMVMAEDVTEEVALQDAVQQQQRRFQQLHQSLGEVLWVVSPDTGAVRYVSPAFATLYGRAPAELLADPRLWLDAVHPDDAGRVAALGHLPPGADSVVSEYRIVRPDGSLRWIEDRRRCIRDGAGTTVLVGGIAEDITVRRERDEARDALQSRLEALVAERTAELAQANIELEAFSRTAAHDLKSPLNGIVGMSQLLRLRAEDRLDAPCLGYIDQIERASCEMASLINDLLALSRAGSVDLQRSTVDLAPMVKARFDELRLLEPLRRVVVEAPPRLEMHCDEGLMRSVLQNLITNAWKFSEPRDEARIVLSMVQDAAGNTLTVADNGVGFDTSGIGELLRPFQRFHTQAQFQGTGLGLVTCQRIVHRHGGRLRLKSQPGVGTEVSLWLPNAPAPAAQA